MTPSVAFHDLLTPTTGDRSSIRLDGGVVAERGPAVKAGVGHDVDGTQLWIMPALYDADAHLPVTSLGLRASDSLAAFYGGVAQVNVALQWQDIRHFELRPLVASICTAMLPRLIPILSVHSDSSSEGFIDWLDSNVSELKALMPPVCKLYSYGPGFWENLDALFSYGLLPIIYCKEFDDVVKVVERASGPVHFRHAMTAELVEVMGSLEGATLQTCPHFLLPIDAEQRHRLFVLPPIADEDVRRGLADEFLDRIDLVVSDHNAPPLGDPTGPGLQVQQDFAASLITASDVNGWPLDQVWAKASTGPAALYNTELGETFVIIDPGVDRVVNLWPRQTPDRAPYLGSHLRGRILAVGVGESAVIV
jgi:dihydroorotase-like cyclic amidohydrolase